MEGFRIPDADIKERIDNRDMPEGTIITQPCFSDCPNWVVLK